MAKFSGRRLRDARRSAGLSQEKTAFTAGISVASLARYEQGTVQPGIDIAASVAHVVGVTIDALLEPTEEPVVAAA